jgi:hypothetical protein
MNLVFQKLSPAHYIFLFLTHLLSLFFILFIFDIFFPGEHPDRTYPGIDIKEFR